MPDEYERFRNKARSELTDEDIIVLHLSSSQSNRLTDYSVTSTLQVAVTSMGATSQNVRIRNLASPMCAFSILDQIGGTYGLSASAETGGSGIEKALHQFCGIHFQTADSYALYALRNSLMHDASLTSTLIKGGQTIGNYYYWYNYDINSLVQHAQRPWDGNPRSLRSENITYLNPDMLRETVNSGVEKIRSSFRANPASVRVKISSDLINVKYLRWVEQAKI